MTPDDQRQRGGKETGGGQLMIAAELIDLIGQFFFQRQRADLAALNGLFKPVGRKQYRL